MCMCNTKQMSIYVCVCVCVHTEATLKTTDNDWESERTKKEHLFFSVVLSHKPLCANGVYKTIIL